MMLMADLDIRLMVNAACVCHEKGVDYCTKCKEPTFVRPKPRYGYPNPELDLTPIGDKCSCSKLFVEPAALPKPCSSKKPPPTYSTCKCSAPSPTPASYYPPAPPSAYEPPSSYEPPKPSDYYKSSGDYYKSTGDYYKPAPLPPPPPIPYKSSSCGCSSASTIPAYPLPDATYAKPKDSTVPADPISISLALQANKAIAVPEAKLAYGFAKKPIDSMKKITFSNVPEENLFKLKHDVITFKKPKLTPAPASVEEEYEHEEVVETADAPAKLTYQQLGYVPEYFKNPKFRKIHTVYSDDYYSHEAGYHLPDKVKVDCGFKPGRMAAYIKRKPHSDAAGYY
ncbi:uncharacterized protein LOC105210601 isoform X2 [Zeugodacus cucurbitae]|uniref:uncharacterized protein LOC105210601 isoform X2 n=1 Tax=Zeugodacus cucurbitae TaxID=28588 RepID=UPI0005968B8C|nr:uncharacterized protein LOC105210601 isoform X2 [Zeugodacus cucurbitae]